MHKKTMIFVEIVLILWALTNSVFLGITILIFVITINLKIKDVSDFNKLKESTSDNLEENELQERLKKIKGNMQRMAPRFEIYKDCVIEDYGGYFEIMGPSGYRVDKLFPSMEDAKLEIDIVEPMLPKIVMKRQRIHNVRFVR